MHYEASFYEFIVIWPKHLLHAEVWGLGTEDNFQCVHRCKCKASVTRVDIVLLKYEFSLTLGQAGARHVTVTHINFLGGVLLFNAVLLSRYCHELVEQPSGLHSLLKIKLSAYFSVSVK